MAKKLLSGIDLTNQRGINFADPTAATDAVTKQYVDNLSAGLSWKDEVRAATTTNGSLETAYTNASPPTRSALTVTALTSYTTGEANISIQEVGLLTAAAGVLFNRVAPFLSFTKTSAVALDVTTQLSQS